MNVTKGGTLKVSPGGALTHGKKIKIVDVGGKLIGNLQGLEIKDKSTLYDFKLHKNGQDIHIEFILNDLTKTLPVRDKRLAKAVSDLLRNPNNSSALQAIVDRLAAMTETQLADAAKKMAPQSIGAAPAVAASQQTQAFGTVSKRVAGLRVNSPKAVAGVTGLFRRRHGT